MSTQFNPNKNYKKSRSKNFSKSNHSSKNSSKNYTKRSRGKSQNDAKARNKSFRGNSQRTAKGNVRKSSKGFNRSQSRGRGFEQARALADKPTPFSQVQKFPHLYCESKGRFMNYYVESHSDTTFFEEYILRKDSKVYREIDPTRSKLFAAVAKGISQIGFKEDSTCLYLGASHGYTVSFLADMLKKGFIFALDFAPRVVRDLVFICEEKRNIAPIMADANTPNTYKDSILLSTTGVDVVFMDIAQKNQVDIFLKNCDAFLQSGGFGLLALKARSVDVTKKPEELFREVRTQLDETTDYNVVDYKELEPLETDHALYVIKKK